MDKEQAIEKLNDIRCHVKETSAEEQALVMAIDALKTQHSQEGTPSDLISRQAARHALCKAVHKGEDVPCENQTASCLWTGTRVCDFVREIDALPTIQPVATDTNAGDKISKFIDGLEEIFADIRERHVDDSVCGLCEYDGAYIGQSGNWYNECPGFDRDDCFKLSDKTRKEWTEEIIKALPPAQPEQAIPLSWIEKYIEWLKSFDNEFVNLAAAHISVMVKKWRDEQDETD